MPDRSDDRGSDSADHDQVVRLRAAVGTGPLFPVKSTIRGRAFTMRVANGFRAGLVLLALAAAPVAGFPADSPAGPPKPEANAAAPKAGAERSLSLAEILTDRKSVV